MKKKTLLLDVDGVIADFIGNYLYLYNKLKNTNKTESDIIQYDINKSLQVSEEDKKYLYNIINASGYAYNIKPYTNSIENVKKLSHLFNVIFLTTPLSTSRTWVYDRNKWLKKYFSDIEYDVIYTSRKDLVTGDLLIDDKIENVTNSCVKSFLWDKPWNQQYNWTRVNNWDQVIRYCSRYF